MILHIILINVSILDPTSILNILIKMDLYFIEGPDDD
jgi:hypothetical protein